MRWSLVATVVAVAGLAPAASAAPSQANEQDMYSDATHTHQVGTRWINCYPPYVVQEGTMTQYRITTWFEVC